METVRNTIVAVVGLCVAVFTFLVMAVVGFAIVGLTAVAGLTGLALSYFRRGPASRRPDGTARRPDEPRVWNDGRGTIIDM